MQIEFRPAQPDDVEAAIALIYSSGPNAFDFVFKTDTHGTALDFLRRSYLNSAGEFGYGIHVVGVIDGKVVAVGGGWSSKNALTFLFVAARQIFSQYGIVAPVVIARGLRTENVIPPPSAGEFYLGHLGVVPAYQSQGIGRLLVEHLITQGKAAGLNHVALDVAATNPRGQALYERLGFVVTRARKSTLKNAHGWVADHRHMVKTI